MQAPLQSHNFGFLADIDPDLLTEAVDAERCFVELEHLDVTVAVFRRFLERLTDHALARLNRPRLLHDAETLRERQLRLADAANLSDLARRDHAEARRLGNKGSHALTGRCSLTDAVEMMRLCRRLAIWYVATLFPAHADLKPPTFKVPQTGDHAVTAAAAAAAAEEARRAALSDAQAAAEAAAALRARVGVHEGLAAAWDSLAPPVRAAAEAAIARLRADPLAPDLGFEPVPDAADPKLHTVPAGPDAALVVAVPAARDVVFALWADTPDAARAWARPKRFEIHPVLGNLQLYEVAPPADPADAPLFAPWSDDELVALGLPRLLLPAVRAVTAEDDLCALALHLPGEAGDALVLLAATGDLAAARAELGLTRPAADDAPVDTADFERAVEHPASQRTFRLLAPDDDLEAALAGSLDAWRVFLHPDQRALVTMRARGPVRVLGGAGTGKTVALLHRAAHLLTEVLPDDERVLVTTFTRNLALDLERHLGRMVPPAAAARADVMNLHRVARRIAETGRFKGFELAQPAHEAQLWHAALAWDALGLDRAFYDAELRDVVHAHGVADEAEYLRVSRAGRGVSLGRRQRRAVWAVLDAFQRLKAERRLFQWPDLVQHARELVERGAWLSPYRAVLADEVQDLAPNELRLVRALAPRAPNDLFLVGDAHQRIYGLRRTSLRQCGVDVVGRSRRLRVNYRTTEEIRDFAVRVLEGLAFDDLDGGVDTLAGYRSLRSGLTPRLLRQDDAPTELDAIVATLADWRARYPDASLCVTARTRALVRDVAAALAARDVPCVVISAEEPAGPGVRVATMHRLKGLEFSCVLLCAARAGVIPLPPPAGAADDEARAAHDLTERALLYVAATRARDELVLTTGGPPSPWLARPAR
ncbi:MAG: UvrD-helicase domain-containing protein [Deltaproteobacteria bacterium]|nr:UvrD-helicase domain-containing protein [Deltaproteobacteria bacterium]